MSKIVDIDISAKIIMQNLSIGCNSIWWKPSCNQIDICVIWNLQLEEINIQKLELILKRLNKPFLAIIFVVGPPTTFKMVGVKVPISQAWVLGL